jgi:hypothetical protein
LGSVNAAEPSPTRRSHRDIPAGRTRRERKIALTLQENLERYTLPGNDRASFVPTFAVPLALMLHGLLLWRLRRVAAATGRLAVASRPIKCAREDGRGGRLVPKVMEKYQDQLTPAFEGDYDVVPLRVKCLLEESEPTEEEHQRALDLARKEITRQQREIGEEHPLKSATAPPLRLALSQTQLRGAYSRCIKRRILASAGATKRPSLTSTHHR